jgi:NDP-sugar pyrophosphorylase family protein
MKGMILAAGFGTRFRPATLDIPKPMVPLCNRPLIDYAFDSLLEGGVDEVIVNLHHLPDQLRAHLDSASEGRCIIHYSHERDILGTGGGIRRAGPLLEGDGSFFVVNGDTVQFPPLRELERARRERDALAALLLRHAPENDRFTPVFLDEGRISGFRTGTGEALMFAGAHAISTRIFSLLPDREFSSITEDVYIPMIASGAELLAGLAHEGPWFDIGTPARYLEASHAVRDMMLRGALPVPTGSEPDSARNAIAAASARVSSGEALVVGERSVVEGGAAVQRSVIWRDCRVQADSHVTDSIVCDGVILPRGARLANVLVCRRRDLAYPEGTVLEGELAAVPVDPSREMIIE